MSNSWFAKKIGEENAGIHEFIFLLRYLELIENLRRKGGRTNNGSPF